MSSLARRSLRNTAAAAGIAAIGVGLASPALAAPSLPPLPIVGGAGTAGPVLPNAPVLPKPGGVVGQIPALPDNISELPMLFTFAGPTLNTAGPTLPTVPAPVNSLVDPGSLTSQVNAPAVDPDQLTSQNSIAGLPSTGVVKQLTGTVLSGQALKGNSLSR